MVFWGGTNIALKGIARPASQRLDCGVRQANCTGGGGSPDSKAVPVELGSNQAIASKGLLDTSCENPAFEGSAIL